MVVYAPESETATGCATRKNDWPVLKGNSAHFEVINKMWDEHIHSHLFPQLLEGNHLLELVGASCVLFNGKCSKFYFLSSTGTLIFIAEKTLHPTLYKSCWRISLLLEKGDTPATSHMYILDSGMYTLFQDFAVKCDRSIKKELQQGSSFNHNTVYVRS